MIEMQAPAGKKKKVHGRIISLRVAELDFQEHKKKSISVQSGTAKITFKFESAQNKADWVSAFKKSLDWTRNTTHMSVSHIHRGMMKLSEEDDSEDEDQQHVFLDDEQKKELKEALSIAFGTKIVQENSKLTKYLADTWQSQASLEESLLDLRKCYVESGDQKLRKAGEKVEASS